MNKPEIVRLLEELGHRLEQRGIHGEMLVVGGTAMALAFNARRQTKDIDAVFEPKALIYTVAAAMARERSLPEDWLNDAVKGFIAASPAKGRAVLDVPGLTVRVPETEYLLAMKAFAARPEDLQDVRLLLAELGNVSLEGVLTMLERYYPRDRIPAKTLFFLEELMTPPDGGGGAPPDEGR